MENSPLDFSDSLRCADNGWTSLCSCGFSQWEIPGWDYFCSAAQKSVRFFEEKAAAVLIGYPRGESLWASALTDLCKIDALASHPEDANSSALFWQFYSGGQFSKKRSHNRIFNLRAMGSASLRRAFWSLCHSAVLRWLDVSHCVSGKKGNFLKFCVVRAF